MDRPVYLTASLYLLKYDCPAGPSSPAITVAMIDVEQDRIVPVLDLSGRGSRSFPVEAEGRYVFQVTCHATPPGKWWIECLQL
jgi:hypothetical protein